MVSASYEPEAPQKPEESDDSFNFEDCFEKSTGIRLDPETLEPIEEHQEAYEMFKKETEKEQKAELERRAKLEAEKAKLLADLQAPIQEADEDE